ncbi:hypothetical protein IFM89_024430 [Coptis chinensis]|uniref:GH3 C-terminal domain-containing protein n=1 Tax=Coptis chinensis TaxID=261450 RepID=A0A835HP97_9MAGN|nr:hypothetical protein IFM89_024430 [Coptis chinensis]
MDYAISRGASINQYKVPRCVNFTPIMELLDSIVISTHFSPVCPRWTPNLCVDWFGHFCAITPSNPPRARTPFGNNDGMIKDLTHRGGHNTELVFAPSLESIGIDYIDESEEDSKKGIIIKLQRVKRTGNIVEAVRHVRLSNLVGFPLFGLSGGGVATPYDLCFDDAIGL